MGKKKLVRKAEPPSKRRIRWPRWTGFRGMTLRSWLELLIIPFALVVIGFLFTMQQDARQQQVEEQRAQDAALQAYFDQMSTLLIDKDLRSSKEGSEVRTLARARTLTVLGTLDNTRKADVIQFLEEAELVQRVEEGSQPVIRLSGADLTYVGLEDANLNGATLSEANLFEAILFNCDLSGADLSEAELSGAGLGNADLSGADLSGAGLEDTDLENANLSNSNLSNAHLSNADLGYANLSDADLSKAFLDNANLSDATGITNEELEQQAYSLRGATMPNGQKYEDWLKSQEG